MNDEPRHAPPQNTIQAVGNVATGLVDALKTQPLLLVLVLFNIAFVIMVYFTAQDTRERQGEMVKHLLENQEKMQQMLARCVPSGRGAVEWPNVTEWPPAPEGEKS